ncbi:FliG C-terminal domain-containing protein [Shigella flexneri]
MKSQQEEGVIGAMRDYDGELARKIIDEMFLFENLIEVDNRSIQRLLQEWFRLAGHCTERGRRACANTSCADVDRAAEIVRDDSRIVFSVRMSQVENEQKSILLIVRRLGKLARW